MLAKPALRFFRLLCFFSFLFWIHPKEFKPKNFHCKCRKLWKCKYSVTLCGVKIVLLRQTWASFRFGCKNPLWGFLGSDCCVENDRVDIWQIHTFISSIFNLMTNFCVNEFRKIITWDNKYIFLNILLIVLHLLDFILAQIGLLCSVLNWVFLMTNFEKLVFCQRESMKIKWVHPNHYVTEVKQIQKKFVNGNCTKRSGIN